MYTEEDVEQALSDAQTREKLLDLIEKVPTVVLSRNDLCLCGSGKKYKKCCLMKDKPTKIAAVQLESIEITGEPLTKEESQNNFQELSPEDEEVMSDNYKNYIKHPERIDSEYCEFFKVLNELHAKYPYNPVIFNHITAGYNYLGKRDRAEEWLNKTYEKFPDYLFAITGKATAYLRDDNPEKAREVLKGAYTLKQLYPHRTVFHVTEARAFEACMVHFFCTIKNFEQAERHLQIMQEILDKGDPEVRYTKKLFRSMKGLHNFEAFFRMLTLSKKE